jgi:hypothetical protein
MPTLQVQPRPTPGERADQPVEVEVDEAMTVLGVDDRGLGRSAPEERDGIAKTALLAENGLDVHILTFT